MSENVLAGRDRPPQKGQGGRDEQGHRGPEVRPHQGAHPGLGGDVQGGEDRLGRQEEGGEVGGRGQGGQSGPLALVLAPAPAPAPHPRLARGAAESGSLRERESRQGCTRASVGGGGGTSSGSSRRSAAAWDALGRSMVYEIRKSIVFCTRVCFIEN